MQQTWQKIKAPPPPTQPIQQPMVPIGNMDAVDIAIQQYLQDVPVMKVTDSRFMGLPMLTADMQVVTFDFQDDKHLNKPALILEILENQQLAQMGRRVIPMIRTGFTSKGVGELFQLAFNIRDPEDGKPVFTADEYPLTPKDIDIDTLPDTTKNIPFATGIESQSLAPTKNVAAEADAYTYLAASLLRLFSKPEENYIKAFKHIVSEFRRFYGSAITVLPSHQSFEGIRSLVHKFTYNEVFRSTLYRILYAGGGSLRGAELRTFLYEMYLLYTGLHIVNIFFKLTNVLKCDTRLLLRIIHCGEFAGDVKALNLIVGLSANKDPQHIRQMWRYGRIFDETFMAPLQTKVCSQLVYFLASALKSASPRENQYILNIKHLADINPSRKKELADTGEMLVRTVRMFCTKSS